MRTRVFAFTIILSGVVAAQTTIPGTFNRTTQAPTSGSGTNGYIVSTPTLSLGNDITPTVITNQDTVNVTLPQNTSLSGPMVQANNPATVTDNAASASAPAANGDGQTAGQASKNFDFVKAPGGESAPVTGSMEDDSVSLGEVARKVRNGKQISKRTITNADVNAMNGALPGADGQPADASGMTGTSMANPAQQNGAVTSEQTSGGAAGAAQPQTPAYAQPSNQGPFGTPTATTNDGTKPNAQQGPGVSPRSSSRPAQRPTPSASDKQQLPESSTKLPLLGVLGSLATLAGLGYLKLR